MAKAAPFSQEELTRRQPVWNAIADLWLDTELQTWQFQYIARILNESHYTDAELVHIYSNEVAPVVYLNLTDIAGEWAMFDEDWLHAEIIKKISNPSFWHRYGWQWRKQGILKDVAEDWERVLTFLVRLQASKNVSGSHSD